MTKILFEVARTRDAEELASIAADAIVLLEEAERLEDGRTKAFALGKLLMSKSHRKVWRFCWPPRIEVEWHFDDLMAAKRVAEVYRSVGVDARFIWRNFDGEVVPAVVADWKEIHQLRRMFNVPGDVMDVVAERFIAQRSLKKAMQEAARDLAMLAMAGVMDLSEVMEEAERWRKKR
ncbi:MAG: hypothetical protein J7K49_00895 [Thaumarchaeota archaeon]|nr:hypothetical protein [Nitrososphaerota archaeon]